MKINLSGEYLLDLENQVRYISRDKPNAAKKFKIELLKNLRKDLKKPFYYKKSIYYDDENIRDYVFKGYTSVYEVDNIKNAVIVFGFIKHKETL